MASIVRYKDRWRAHIRTNGRAISKIFDTKRDALLWARAEEAKTPDMLAVETVRRAADLGASDAPTGRRGPVTFGDVLDCYERDSRRAAGASKECAIKPLRAGLGKRRLTELDAIAFIEYGKKRAAVVSPATINTELTYAGTALRFAGVLLRATDAAANANAHMASARTILRHMNLIGQSVERSRRPTEDELRRLRDYCRSHRTRFPMWEMILFAIATGMRLGEITRVRWEDVDRERRTILIRDRKHPTKKQGNDGLIPLLKGPVTILGEVVDPLEVILKISKQNVGRIFPYAQGAVTCKFMYIRDKVGVDDLHFHDFRHDAISRLFEFGYHIEQVALVSGHRDWKHLKRYTNINPASLHNVTL